MFWIGMTVFVISIIIKRLLESQPPPIAGVYMQPGPIHSLKFWLFYGLLWLRKRQNEKQQKSKTASGQNSGYGIKSRNTIEDMDKAQELPKEHPQAVDAVYFNGANKGGYFLVAATARRHNNLVQTLLYLRIPGVGLLELPSLPDTELYTTKEMSYSAGGLEILPVTPMKKWRLSYEGKMRLIKEEDKEKIEEVHVSFDVDWDSDTKCYDFDTDLHPYAVCDAMARETWNREFFNNLKVAHQTHYEQFGEISGTIHIEKYGDKSVKLRGVRDHSYGNVRDWKDLHRYGIQYLHLEDGSAICIGLICMPRTLSRLAIGYIFHPDGSMDAVSSTDFELHKLGEDRNPPSDFEFSFIAGNKTYKLEGHVLDAPIFYMGLEWEARIHERMCEYKVNGIKGTGISEWDYRNHTGRPALYDKEPQQKC